MHKLKLLVGLLVLSTLLLSVSIVPKPNTVNAQDDGSSTPSLPDEGDDGEETHFIEGPFSLPLNPEVQELNDLAEFEIIEGPFSSPVDADAQGIPSSDLVEPEVIEGPFSLPVDSGAQETPSDDQDSSEP